MADSDESELDQAYASHDAQRIAYVYRRLQIRRRMAIALFVVFLAGGLLLISFGIAFDGVARRIGMIASIIITFMSTVGGLISFYWGAGAYEQGSFFTGNSNSGGYAPPPAPCTDRPHLSKNAKPASTDESQD